ncbi:MAG TPA: hypothetical protein VMI54_16935 [Polyangiaceae bacterium]|nr:hypothetical protein [Polyangiaceae bacterium]
MRAIIAKLAFVGATLFVLGATGCSADVHDNTLDVHDNNANINDAKVAISTTSDTSNVQAGSTVHVDVKAQDVYLCDPNTTPPSDDTQVAGHFEFFLDDTSGTSLLVTASESVDVMIPAATPSGDHKLVCRIDKHDGTPTMATSDIDITVKASASVSGSVSGSASSSN